MTGTLVFGPSLLIAHWSTILSERDRQTCRAGSEIRRKPVAVRSEQSSTIALSWSRINEWFARHEIVRVVLPDLFKA